MKRVDPVLVRKRDGGCEPFEHGKLRRSLSLAMRACQYDERFADSLAKAVGLHVEGWRDRHPPTSDYIFRCVRTVLKETGLADVARQIGFHRNHRARRRRGVQVLDGTLSDTLLRPWRKADVVRTLERGHRVSPAVARILAGVIEERVLMLNYEVLTTALIDELIRSEVIAWGLADADLPVQPAAPRTDPAEAG